MCALGGAEDPRAGELLHQQRIVRVVECDELQFATEKLTAPPSARQARASRVVGRNTGIV
jgi:hypothetical protein